jgi:MFS superfamily sulfate permease-like transporter
VNTDGKQPVSEGAVWQKDFLASVVVFLVALPLCMGVAIASGAPVSAGLITGIVGGLVVGVLSGCPLSVSGPAAGLTVIIYDIIQRFGLEMMGLIVLIAGLIQIAAGALRLGQWFRAVSPAVVRGMLAGIGVLIFASQFHVMVDDEPKGSGIENLVTIPAAIQKGVGIPESIPREARQEQRRVLQELGELHRRQIQLNEAVHQRLPDHVAEVMPEDVVFTDLAEVQEEIVARVNELVEQSNAAFASQPARQEQVRELGTDLRKALQANLASLEQNRSAEVLGTQREALDALKHLMAGFKNHEFAAWLGILTILSLILWKPLARGRLSVVPAPLVAVVVATVAATAWQFPVLYVQVPDSILDEINLVTLAMLQDAPWRALISAAILVAVVASAETLLCATAVDQLHSGPRTKYDKELVAQGVGNSICGFLGALPMTGVIVRSSANVLAGGRTRLSTILHGLWLLVFVIVLAAILRLIPTSALAAILVYTGYKLVDWKSIRELAQFGWGEVAVYTVTVVVIVVEDLLMGVIVGVVLAALKLLYTFSHVNIAIKPGDAPSKMTMTLDGAATFLRLPQLAEKLEQVPPGVELHMNIDRLIHIDHACLDLLSTWERQHERTGGSLVIDWLHLQSFSQNGQPRRDLRGSPLGEAAERQPLVVHRGRSVPEPQDTHAR